LAHARHRWRARCAERPSIWDHKGEFRWRYPEEWELGHDVIEALSNRGWTCLKASARMDVGVEEAFLALVGKMMEA
jgi:hypothetical protein